METLMAFTVGVMAAGSVYLLLSHNLVRVLFGLILLSNAANFVIFAAGGMSEGLPPLIGRGESVLMEPYSNPLPQALILTAIVISFGLLAFALVLVYRGYQELGTLDSDRMRLAEPPYPDQEIPEPEEPNRLRVRECRPQGREYPERSILSWYLVAPIAVPMTSAVICILLWNRLGLQRIVSTVAAGAHLAVAMLLMARVWQGGILAAQMGDWPAPFGITLVADHLSAVMVLITGIMGFGVGLYSLRDVDENRERSGFHPLYHVLLTGVTGSFITGDLFNLYVWFEVMLISSFALLALGSEKVQLDGAIKYAAINLVSTVMFLIAIAVLYGLTGTLNMADLAVRVPQVEQQGMMTTVAVMFMIAFGIKSAVFPLFFWLPASYHTPAVTVSAIFAGLLTKVGVYALVRTFTLIFTTDVGYTHTALLVVAGLTMLTGVLGAAAQNEIRRILSFHIISQIGYMVMGLALYTPLGLIGAVFYLVHHIIVKTNLFLVAGVARRLTGSMELKKIGGLYKSSPLLAVLFLIPALSLAGIPPLSGFWAKLVLIRASLEIGSWAIAAVAILVGLLTMFSMTKIWGEAFWKPHPDGDDRSLSIGDLTVGERVLLVGPIVVFAALTVAIGLVDAAVPRSGDAGFGRVAEPGPLYRRGSGARQDGHDAVHAQSGAGDRLADRHRIVQPWRAGGGVQRGLRGAVDRAADVRRQSLFRQAVADRRFLLLLPEGDGRVEPSSRL